MSLAHKTCTVAKFSPIPKLVLLLFVSLVCALSTEPAFAQTSDVADSFSFFDVAQPQGPVTAAYLRMHQPLYLLSLCRQVKAGALSPQKVEGLVGGRSVLAAILAMDLDALYRKLTEPPVAGAARSTKSLWQQILTNGETAPLPRLEPLEAVTFRGVRPADFLSQVIRVTALADGALQARLASDSPFQILSMESNKGVIVDTPLSPDRSILTRLGGSDTFLSPEVSRTQAPWVVPVVAGQDVEITVALPAGTRLPALGVSSTMSFGDPGQNLWSQDDRLLAEPAVPLSNDIYISVNTPKHWFDVPEAPFFNQNFPLTFTIPLTLSTPFPAVTVKGTVQLLSMPPGVSMPTYNFTLQPQGSVNLTLLVAIDRMSQTWHQRNISQPFSIKVSYQTVPAFAANAAIVNFHFTIYDSTQSWFAKGNAGGVNCEQSVLLYSDGTLSRSGDCDNRNFFNAKVVSEGTLVLPKVVSDVYFMGFFSQDFKFSSVSWAYGQTNYVFIRSQPLIMSWTKF